MSNANTTESQPRHAAWCSRRSFLAGAGAAAAGFTILRPELVAGYQANEKVDIGVIGCGNISRFHFQGLKKAGAHVVHIADMNEKAAGPYVKETGARFSKDYHDVLRNKEVDTVFVLTSAKTQDRKSTRLNSSH